LSATSLLVLTVTAATILVADGQKPGRAQGTLDLASRELEALVEHIPQKFRATILSRRSEFLKRLEEVLDRPPELLVLVDKSHGLNPEYAPRDLVSLNDHQVNVSRGDLQVRTAILPDLLAMIESARSEHIELPISSAFRAYEYQQELYERNVAQLGREQADRESARAGSSQHQLGTTLDFGSITDDFGRTDAGQWLLENSWRFGFSLSYPEDLEPVTGYRHEIWHYRYITPEASLFCREFFGSIQHYLLEFLDQYRGVLTAARSR